jgi:hypothetical protein
MSTSEHWGRGFVPRTATHEESFVTADRPPEDCDMYRPSRQEQARTQTSKGEQIHVNQTEGDESITKSRKSIG